MRLKMFWVALWCAFLGCGFAQTARAAGTLKDSASGGYAEIVDHRVKVVLNNGFARTEVTQVFHNGSGSAIDAIYEFPIPEHAALSEMKIVIGDRVMNGTVLPRDQAQKIYDEQNSAGNQAGLATKDGHQNFRFQVANIPADSDAEMSFAYYEPLSIDESVGRYLYPLQDGGTSSTPWDGNQNVTGTFSFELELKSTMPIAELGMPGLSPMIQKLGDGHFRVSLEAAPGSLGKDLVLNYRFPSDQPRQIELESYRPSSGGTGTFMMVLTPGTDLQPITGGTNYVFVLDVSGSMDSKLDTVIDAVVEALAKLGPKDRFRVVTFSDGTSDISGGWLEATPANIANVSANVQALMLEGGTNLYGGLMEGLAGLDSDRVVSAILVTDAETNEGIVEPVAFDQLMRQNDIRVYGMLMGNNANWPLMQILTEASGGFYAQVSNQDDIATQVGLAFDKATHETLHDVKLEVTGDAVSDTTDFRLTKIYQGQQLVLFGRYAQPGFAQLNLHARASGKPISISQSGYLPDADEQSPELQQLWALDMVHAIEREHLLGMISDAEAKSRITELGVDYQLVTDYTAMIVVDEKTLQQYGVEDGTPSDAPGAGSGSGYSGTPSTFGGAVDPVLLGLFALLGLGLLALAARERLMRKISV
jgi:Ca-activated chloride channel homolog